MVPGTGELQLACESTARDSPAAHSGRNRSGCIPLKKKCAETGRKARRCRAARGSHLLYSLLAERLVTEASSGRDLEPGEREPPFPLQPRVIWAHVCSSFREKSWVVCEQRVLLPQEGPRLLWTNPDPPTSPQKPTRTTHGPREPQRCPHTHRPTCRGSDVIGGTHRAGHLHRPPRVCPDTKAHVHRHARASQRENHSDPGNNCRRYLGSLPILPASAHQLSGPAPSLPLPLPPPLVLPPG